MKIVLIGAGSHSFGRGQIVDLMRCPELRGRGVTLSLVDEDSAALATMTALARCVQEYVGSDLIIESQVDRRPALPGADYVITAVARKRMPLWEQDFRVPQAYGFRHCLGENGGPGALFHALRSFELIMPICRDIEQLCPRALLLNFTNPEARVLHAICHLTSVKAVGICHGVFSAMNAASRYLERPLESLNIVSAGMNHFYTLLRVEDKETGQSLLAELHRRALADDSPLCPPLFKKMLQIYGVFGYVSDGHIGEYLSFGSDPSGAKWHYGQESRPVPVIEQSPLRAPIEDYASGRAALDEWVLRRSGEITVPMICDIELNRRSWRPAVNVLNSGSYIRNLPHDGVIEVPAVVDGMGIHPQSVGALPEPFAAFIRTQFSIISLVTEAYRTRSKRLLLQALLLDPVVHDIGAAEKLLDDMLALQADYLPQFG